MSTQDPGDKKQDNERTPAGTPFLTQSKQTQKDANNNILRFFDSEEQYQQILKEAIQYINEQAKNNKFILIKDGSDYMDDTHWEERIKERKRTGKFDDDDQDELDAFNRTGKIPKLEGEKGYNTIDLNNVKNVIRTHYNVKQNTPPGGASLDQSLSGITIELFRKRRARNEKPQGYHDNPERNLISFEQLKEYAKMWRDLHPVEKPRL